MSNVKCQMSPPGQQGSAIVLALVIVSLVAVSAFSVSRILISEIRIETGLEDASGAYLVAEAALENALAEYRKNHNYQMSAEFLSNTKAVPFLDGVSKRCTSERPSCLLTPRVIPLGADLSGNAQAKELVFYNAVSPKSQGPETLPADELIEKEISAFHLSVPSDAQGNSNCGAPAGSPIKFCWNWASSGTNRTMEIALLDKDGKLLPGFPIYETGQTGTERIITVPSTATILRFRPIGAGLKPLGDQTNPDGSPNPAYRPAYAFNTSTKSIDSGLTTIEATGEFGRSQRKLKVEIDRKRDVLIGEFDFTVFSGGDL